MPTVWAIQYIDSALQTIRSVASCFLGATDRNADVLNQHFVVCCRSVLGHSVPGARKQEYSVYLLGGETAIQSY